MTDLRLHIFFDSSPWLYVFFNKLAELKYRCIGDVGTGYENPLCSKDGDIQKACREHD